MYFVREWMQQSSRRGAGATFCLWGNALLKMSGSKLPNCIHSTKSPTDHLRRRSPSRSSGLIWKMWTKTRLPPSATGRPFVSEACPHCCGFVYQVEGGASSAWGNGGLHQLHHTQRLLRHTSSHPQLAVNASDMKADRHAFGVRSFNYLTPSTYMNKSM